MISESSSGIKKFDSSRRHLFDASQLLSNKVHTRHDYFSVCVFALFVSLFFLIEQWMLLPWENLKRER